MDIPKPWQVAVEAYLLASRSRGDRDSTLYTRRQHLAHLATRIAADPWEVTGAQLVAYTGAQDWMRETRRGRRATFLSFYRWGVQAGHIDHNPAEALEAVKPGEPAPNPVPDPVYLAALARADATEQLWIDLAAEHGLRRGEIAVVRGLDLIPTLLGYDLRVHGKGGKIRYVPLTAAMQRALLDLQEQLGDGWLFPGDQGGHVSGRWISKRVGRLLDGPWTIHKLRHRAAGRFWEVSDHDALAVMKLMGWASMAMIEVYVAMPRERLASIVHDASRSGAPLAA